MAENKLMYSTESGSHKNSKDKPKKAAANNAGGPSKMRLETAGRGGKAVTVIFNMPFNSSQAKDFMREMQSKFGCGATHKNDTIELRGDMRDRVAEFFAAKNLKIIRAGG